MTVKLSRTPRLYLKNLVPGATLAELSAGQAHYLSRVMRLGKGDAVRVFATMAGEWLAHIETIGKSAGRVRLVEQLRDAQSPGDIEYLFAPLKTARLDYTAQKATEMGAGHIRPVLTEHTQMRRVNMERFIANTIEAAEQCNLVWVPGVSEPRKLTDILAGWDNARALVFCDESAPSASPLEDLMALKATPVSVLVGPEGGFSDRERDMIRQCPSSLAISLGPRIMRADTAAVAALALVQSTIGDWSL